MRRFMNRYGLFPTYSLFGGYERPPPAERKAHGGGLFHMGP